MMHAQEKRTMVAVVTLGRRQSEVDAERARSLARQYGLPFVDRHGDAIDTVIRRAQEENPNVSAAIVVGGDGLSLYAHGQRFFYHPGMGVNRIRQIRQGRSDWMIEAMGLGPGDHVLDCTLGIGSDALVSSFVAGPEGRVVGLESEPLMALIVREGMKHYRHDVPEVTSALRRIDVTTARYQEYLAQARAGSFDVVYFDPMFSEPVAESRHMIPIRLLANYDPLTSDSLEAARRVARRQVVVKDRREGPYVQSGWFDRILGGERSRVAYCIVDV